MAKVLQKGFILGLSAILFLAFYPAKLARYCFDRLFAKATINPIGIQEVYAEVFCTADQCVKIMFPDAQNVKKEVKALTDGEKRLISKAAGIEFDPELDKEYNFYIAEKNGQVIGYTVEDTVKGKWGPIRYMAALDPAGKIRDVIVMELVERRGRPVKERRFLDQFVGKDIASPIKLNKDVKGVAGATISSRGMSNGVRKLVYVFNELYKK
ncbi:MAG: FMN-binding protein [Candidatus Omnitrophica bacterium]|nr:FMN-binding protein [Candidatus Omnitrophota bacterium]